MVTATAIVMAITGAASALGPKWSGLLSPFPVFACVMAVFSHQHGGAGAAHRLLHGVIVGSFAFAAFFVVVALVRTRESCPRLYPRDEYGPGGERVLTRRPRAAPAF
jgi:hypothetical protein